MFVDRISPDGLSRTRWGFGLQLPPASTCVVIVFDIYAEETRATKRHKWKCVRSWTRRRIDREQMRSSTRIERPSVPAEVRGDAFTLLLERAVFVEAEEK